jgi:hypothetical protein
MPNFEEVWDDIQRRLPIGIEIPNWSYDGRTRVSSPRISTTASLSFQRYPAFEFRYHAPPAS